MAGRLLIGPESNSSTKHVVPTSSLPFGTTPGFTVDMDAHFSSITCPSTPVRTGRRIQGAIFFTMSLHIFFRDALDATQIRALHMALRAVKALVQSTTRFGSYSLTAPHAGPRTHVLLVVFPLLKRYFQPAAQATTDGSPQTFLLHVCFEILGPNLFTTTRYGTGHASPSTLTNLMFGQLGHWQLRTTPESTRR